MPESAAAPIALVLGVVLAPLVTWWFRHRLVVDVPNVRSAHVVPVPRGGGLAIAAAATTAVALADVEPSAARLALASAPLAFAMLGLADDLLPVVPRHRLAFQVALGVATCALVLDDLTGSMPWRVVFAIGVAIWVIAYVNAFNFMDGINGISAVTAIVGGAAWWLIGRAEDVEALRWSGAILALATIGFVPLNFPRARVFLGDAGSYFIGAWSAVVVVLGLRAGVEPEAVLAPVALYLSDTSSTLVRRFRRGESLTSAHRDHAYQRLVACGASHAAVTLGVGVATVACGALGLLAARGGAWRAPAVAALVAVAAAYVLAGQLAGRHRADPAAQ